MPEREYFSLRYAIPGYTFILLVIGINYVPLLKILEITEAESAFGAFLAFLSLFTGSAIGFLISQFWYWRFNKKPILGTKELEPAALEIYKKHLKAPEEIKNESKEIKDNIEAIGAVFDYIIRLEEQEKIFELTENRWDMYHVLSSTLYALGIGLGVGIICRVYYQVFLFSASSPHVWKEVVALILIFAGVAFLLMVFWKGRKTLMTSYCPLLKAFVIKSKITTEELRKVLPDYFPTEK